MRNVMNTKFKIALWLTRFGRRHWRGGSLSPVVPSKATRLRPASQSKTLYTCGMHPQVIQDHPGNCPICGMKLTPIRKQPSGRVRQPPGKRKIKYYKSTMIPGETSPKPGKDSMGMDMVPVYEDRGGRSQFFDNYG